MPALTDELRARIEVAVAPLHGWTTPEKAWQLAELILMTSATRSVEIGVFGGRGTISMAMAHAALGHGYVVGIDPWQASASVDGTNDPAHDAWWRAVDYDEVLRSFLRALLRHHVLDYGRVLRERSDTAVRLFADESVMVLHQDGNHSEEVSTREVDLWTPKIARGGYWVADDADWATTQPALRRLAASRFDLVDDRGSWRIYRKP